MKDREIRAALDRHWAASDANDFEAEHDIYREDAVLECPQSGERIRGWRKIQSPSCESTNFGAFRKTALRRRGLSRAQASWRMPCDRREVRHQLARPR
jgi:hypothetical protein